MSVAAHDRSRPGLILPLALAISSASAILLAVYPGFMSYDSLRALREARGSVGGGTYPPFVSYVWRVLDWIWPGPALMLWVEDFLLLFSFATAMRILGYRAGPIVAAVAMFCLAPPILGPMLVVWKDVGVSACLAAAVASMLAAERRTKPTFALVVAMLMMVCGAAYRLNAITAVVPLVIWLAWQRIRAGWPPRKALFGGAVAFFAIAGCVVVVNRYRFPDFELLPPSDGLKSIMIFDLAAMTALTGRNQMPRPEGAPVTADWVEYFRTLYDPRHNEAVEARDGEGRLALFFALPDQDVRAAYLSAVSREPRAWLERRGAVFRELVGLADGPTFYPTEVGIVPNEEGFVHKPTRLTARVLDYVWNQSHYTLGKPWLYYAVGTSALVLALIRRKALTRAAAIAVYASGVLYLLPFFFISPAADVRYNHWSLVCMFIVMALAAAPSWGGAGRTARVESSA